MTLKDRRRALMAVKKGGGGLPSEYQQCEYIESSTSGSSGSYLNITGINLPSGTEIEIKSHQTESANSSIHCVFGSKLSTSFEVYYYKGAVAFFGNVTEKEVTMGVDYDTIVCTLTTTKTSAYVFCYGTNDYYFKGRVFSVKAEKDGMILLNLVPCYRIADTEVGMYDTVSNTFFANAGTGTFTKGADVA